MDYKLQRCDEFLYMVCCPCKLCSAETFEAVSGEARTVPFVCCWAAQVYAEIDSTAEASPPPAAQKMTHTPAAAPAAASASSSTSSTVDKSAPLSVSQKVAQANKSVGGSPGMQRMPSQKAVDGVTPSTPTGSSSPIIARTPTGGNSGGGALGAPAIARTPTGGNSGGTLGGSNSPKVQRVPSANGGASSTAPTIQRSPTANRTAPALPSRS